MCFHAFVIIVKFLTQLAEVHPSTHSNSEISARITPIPRGNGFSFIPPQPLAILPWKRLKLVQHSFKRLGTAKTKKVDFSLVWVAEGPSGLVQLVAPTAAALALKRSYHRSQRPLCPPDSPIAYMLGLSVRLDAA
jgi:hypothetical protein